jgi:hypothetical protein
MKKILLMLLLWAMPILGQEPDSVVVIVSVDTSTVGLVVVPTDTLFELRPGDTAQVSGFILDTTTGDPVEEDYFQIRWFSSSEFVTVDQVTGLVVAEDIQGNRKIRATVYGRVIYVPLPPPDTLPPTEPMYDGEGHLIPDNGYELIDVSTWGISDPPPPLDWSWDFENCGDTRQPPVSGGVTGGTPGWGSNGIPSIPYDSVGAPGTGCAALFPFHADRGQPPGDSWQELRFHLGGWYDELYAEYDTYIPANYVHRDSTGSDNNKFFFFYGFKYQWTGKAWWATYPLNGTGPRSRLSIKYTNVVEGIGSGGKGMYNDFITPDDLGTWINIRIAVEYGSEPNNADGRMRLWKNGALTHDLQNIQLCPDHQFRANNADGTYRNVINRPCGATSGYIWGWANSGFLDRTPILVDNWRITNTYPW